jgi:hydrogenase expression/formation protein HypD
VIFCSYGDMLRVPGSGRDLFSVKAQGGDVRVVYSPLDAVTLAEKNPDKQVVFLCHRLRDDRPAECDECVAGAAAWLEEFFILVSHVRVPPAISAILSSPHNRVQGFLLAGHVNAVMGYWEYPPLAEKFNVPMAVTGFEPLDIVQGILKTVQLLEEGKVEVANAYQRAVTFEGLKPAQDAIQQSLHGMRPQVARHWDDPHERLGLASRVR